MDDYRKYLESRKNSTHSGDVTSGISFYFLPLFICGSLWLGSSGRRGQEILVQAVHTRETIARLQNCYVFIIISPLMSIVITWKMKIKIEMLKVDKIVFDGQNLGLICLNG